MKKSIIIVFLAIILILSILLSMYFYNQPSTKITSSCQIIQYSEGKKINIVYLTQNLSTSDVKKSISSFLSTPPFSQNKDKFNFYYAGSANCKIVEDYIFCYSKDTIKQSSLCPNNYIIILSSQNSDIRSSAYLNLISLNINSPDSTLVHEFGHIFGNLADEYIPSQIPSGSKNCNNKCQFLYNISACFPGCSKNDYYRSSEDSVMRSLKTNNYQKLNTLLINENLNKYG